MTWRDQLANATGDTYRVAEKTRSTIKSVISAFLQSLCSVSISAFLAKLRVSALPHSAFYQFWFVIIRSSNCEGIMVADRPSRRRLTAVLSIAVTKQMALPSFVPSSKRGAEGYVGGHLQYKRSQRSTIYGVATSCVMRCSSPDATPGVKIIHMADLLR